MMNRRPVPIFATLIVLCAIGVMIALGVWQLQRAEWKDAMLARFHAAQTDTMPIAFPRDPEQVEDALYRPSTLTCERVEGWQATAGLNAKGESGFAHVASCVALEVPGHAVEVIVGWSTDPAAPQWQGGAVSGIVGPSGENGARLVADPPVADLQANKKPDPSSIPNNHLAYAVQWFLFAMAAAVIYALAVRRRFGAGASETAASANAGIGPGAGIGAGAGLGAGEGAGSGAGDGAGSF